MKKGLLFLMIVVLSACKEQGLTPDQSLLIGTWEYSSPLPVSSEFPKGAIVMKKTGGLPDNNTGIQFKTNKSLLSRDGIGRCASPISFSNFPGKWTLKSKELTIRKATWDGKDDTLHYKIISVDHNQLVIAYL